ncbi:MAG: PHP domain-containing protein [Chloroflexota bacterium]
MTGSALPPDNHVHSQFSWDAVGRTSMEAACRRALELGLPSVAFTEHLDLVPWYVPPVALDMFPRVGARYVGEDSTFRAPAVDLDGYFASIERCRSLFPSLRILTGVEFGEPHWFGRDLAELLARGHFQRVLGSLHSLEFEGRPRVLDEWFHTQAIAGEAEAAAVRAYLAELTRMAETGGGFEVVAHIDYLVRQIRQAGRDHEPRAFEAEYRETLSSLARSGRVLEINVRLPLDPLLVRWWHEVGGGAVSFGSDAHTPGGVGARFAEAAAVAEAAGFRPQADRFDFWRR